MQRLELTAPELDGFSYAPGPGRHAAGRRGWPEAGAPPVHHPRSCDRSALRLDHRRGQARRRSGRALGAVGRAGRPDRGHRPARQGVPSPAADWHLFMGDESAMPAILAMTSRCPATRRRRWSLEVPEAADEQEYSAAAEPASAGCTGSDRPAGTRHVAARRGGSRGRAAAGPGHAYLLGEASVVLAMRERWPARGCRRTRCRRRLTGAAVAPMPAMASPPGTPDAHFGRAVSGRSEATAAAELKRPFFLTMPEAAS